jgi:hypothetical protein
MYPEFAVYQQVINERGTVIVVFAAIALACVVWLVYIEDYHPRLMLFARLFVAVGIVLAVIAGAWSWQP